MRVIDEKLLAKILSYIKTYQVQYGKSPSYRNIMKRFGLSSLSIVYRYVELLYQRGVINKDSLGAIEISRNLDRGTTINAPIVGTVTCGSPIYAQENIEGMYQLPTAIFGSQELFLLKAEGDSMEGVGIKTGDLLVVRKSDYAENGQIVVALLEDSATVKTFYKKSGYYQLHPENPKYDDIITKEVKILGIVEHFIHKL